MQLNHKEFPLSLPISIVITDKTLIDKIFIILNAYGFTWGGNRDIDLYLNFRQINAIYLRPEKRLMYTSGKHESDDRSKEYTDVEFLELGL